MKEFEIEVNQEGLLDKVIRYQVHIFYSRLIWMLK